MNFWQEKWDNWLVIYTVLTVYSTLIVKQDFVLALVFVAVFLFVAQIANIRIGIQCSTLPAALLSALCQLGAVTITVINIRMSAVFSWEWFVVVMGLLIASVVLTIFTERHVRELPSPRYGTEAFLITFFAIGYLVTIQAQIRPAWVSVAIVHMAILTVTMVRNLHLVYHRVQEPTKKDGYITWADEIGIREEKGWAAFRAVCRLPSSILGAVAIVLDVVVIGIYFAMSR